MKHHYKKWTPEFIKEFGEFYKNNPVKVTAKHYNMSIKYCYEMASVYGLTKKRVDVIWDDGDDYLVVGLDAERVRRKVIADKMDKTEKQVNHFIEKLKKTGRYYPLLMKYVSDNNHRFRG